jgi:hypothetical protein
VEERSHRSEQTHQRTANAKCARTSVHLDLPHVQKQILLIGIVGCCPVVVFTVFPLEKKTKLHKGEWLREAQVGVGLPNTHHRQIHQLKYTHRQTDRQTNRQTDMHRVTTTFAAERLPRDFDPNIHTLLC